MNESPDVSICAKGGGSVDESQGYEGAAEAFMGIRSASRIGVATVREWMSDLPRGAAVLDLGCGGGGPISEVLIEVGNRVYGVDASPRMVAMFRARFPGVPVECETIERSTLFERRFDGVVAWGLMFLLPARTQELVIHKVARALREGGRFLFTAPSQVCEWEDVLTSARSVSLGSDAYRSLLEEAGLVLVDERQDEGENHYYLAVKPGVGPGR